LVGRTALERKTVHLPDCLADPEYKAFEYQRVGQYRTMLGIPLQQGDAAIGVIALFRSAVKPFSERQIDLVATFASQAVIAIENARLFDELQTKTRDLEQSLQQQTATADVLQVINSSPGHIEPVFAAMLEKATHLCKASFGILWLCDGEQFRTAALHGVPPAYAEITRTPIRPLPTNPLGRMLRGERLIVSADVADEEPYRTGDPARRALVDLAGARSVIQVALAKDEKFLGSLTVYRNEVRPFSEKQIVLLQNFAAQAVIAMENVRLFGELRESLQQQTATADVLKVISRSAFDLQTVLEELTRSAASLCNADMATITRQRADGHFYHVTNHNFPSDWLEYTKETPLRPSRGTVVGRTLMEKKPVQVPDVTADAEYTHGHQQKKAGYRTFLGVPLLREGKPIGVFSLCRKTVAPFSEKQIELVSGFADQAVIAIENVRLFEEVQARTEDLRESLQQQTATADVLKVISRSTFDLQTVLDTLVESVTRLCEADHSWLFQREGDLLWFKSSFGHGTATHERIRELFLRREVPLDRTSISGRSALEGRVVHVPDVLQDREYGWSEAQQIGGYRAALGAPLLRDGKVVGVIFVAKVNPEPFSQKQIELVATFADQAVIAIENVRLFEEVQAKTEDLRESLQQQTATADVLKVISRSTFDLETVLGTLLETVTRLCRADQAYMFRRHADGLHYLIAEHGLSEEGRAYVASHPFKPDRGTTSGRVALERRPIHIPDVLADPDYTYTEGQRAAGFRTLLGLPLLREDTLIGVFVIGRSHVEPFTTKEIELATSFADQAVIAIENARLLEELRERQAELRVTFDNMGDGVVMFSADKQLVAWNRNLQQMLDLPDAVLLGRPSFAELFRYLSARGEFGSADLEAELGRSVDDTGREMRYERTRPDGRVIEVRRNPVPDGGFVLIYADITERKRAEEAIRLARDAAETALRELQTAQDRLIQTEKLASLGQLTAGIAHEIKNPLNFVNNFSALSAELIEELDEILALVPLDRKLRSDVNELTILLKSNLEKVIQHGKRADSIVRNMLQHSRESSGERRSADINALVEESLNLAYHGARAEKPGFAITLRQDFDPDAGALELYPQDITRALLNLISNGFYAAVRRKAETDDGAFEPILSATTRNLGQTIEIRIRDNGSGIPPDVREKMFNPFFTTKPTGEGTGLGLSMTHDIVVKQHGGRIDVETQPGTFSEFIVTLPRGNGDTGGSPSDGPKSEIR
jgi:PAS domain S-box-containing protein